MNNKIEFVIVSADDKFKMSREYLDNVMKQRQHCHFTLVENNTQGLPEVYNQHIVNAAENTDVKMLVFMHADVSLDMIGLVDSLESCSDKYDVMGLCGCSKISVTEKPLNWFCGSRQFPESRWGCVSHGELNDQISFFSGHSPDVSDHEVACIDGLLIAMTRKAIDSGLKFDTQFKFSHYDTDISFETVLHHKLKLGVIVRKDLRHWSIGRSILEKSFLDAEVGFRKKWSI